MNFPALSSPTLDAARGSDRPDRDAVIAATIVRSIRRHAHGDLDALARNIILDLADAGFAVSPVAPDLCREGAYAAPTNARPVRCP